MSDRTPPVVLARFTWVLLVACIGTLGTAQNIAGQVSRFEVLAAFDPPFLGGAVPSGLIQASDGSFYGTTGEGGTNNLGTVFKLDTDGTRTTLHSFASSEGRLPSDLIQGSDGSFYGTTGTGGAHGSGTVFKLDAAGTLTTLHSFNGSDGALPYWGLIQSTDGRFYGTTRDGGSTNAGTVFTLDTEGTVSTVHVFSAGEGVRPSGGVIQGSDGSLYGTTSLGGVSGGGTVCKLDAAGMLTTVYNFTRQESVSPSTRLTQASDGTFYGTSQQGGANQWGTVFKLDATWTLTILHRFNMTDGRYPSNLIQASDGSFYGTTQQGGAGGWGTVFNLDLSGTLTTLTSFAGNDGARPFAGLIQASDGNFYGTTQQGGEADAGTVFKVDAAGMLTSFYGFTGTRAGAHPFGGVIQGGDGCFYGTTRQGGASGVGTIFRFDPAGTLTTLHSFTLPGGRNPRARLIQAGDGSLYGTTEAGDGASGVGTVFRLDTAGTLTTVHSFTDIDGRLPRAGLIQGLDQRLYGTTFAGALSSDGGTVFALDSAGTLTTLHGFAQATGGRWPNELIQAVDGRLYGTTAGGGAFRDSGTVFTLDASGTLTTLHSFGGFDGSSPQGAMIQGRDGSFYGTTSGGGRTGFGTVFKVDAAGVLTTLHYFSSTDGASPYGALIEGSDGSLYGTTEGGGANRLGTVFQLDPGGTLTTLHSFSGRDGEGPLAGLTRASDGSFYGTTPSGGRGGGVIFRLRSGSTPWVVPGAIEAEDYDLGGPGLGYLDSTPGNEGGAYRTDDVDIKPSAEGGYAVGWMTAGEWLAYTADVQGDGGLYTIQARVGSALPDRTFHIEIDGRNITGPIAVPRFEDWDQYGIASLAGVRLDAGRQVLRVVIGPQDYVDFQRLTIVGEVTDTAIPGDVEAENYDLGGPGVGYVDSTPGNEGGAYRTDDVDIKPSGEGGYAVGWMTAGEWLAYTVDVDSDGFYTILARVGSALTDRAFHIEVDGRDLTGPIAVPQFEDWDQYGTVSVADVRLRAGRQVLRVVMGPEDYMDFQRLTIVRQVNGTAPSTVHR